MRLHKTGHAIADTVSDLIGELPDGDYNIAYGILRHNHFSGGCRKWFELDRGMWGAGHYNGLYRLSFRGTQPRYNLQWESSGKQQCDYIPNAQLLEPWRKQDGPALICPPTQHVCEFFKIDYTAWLMNAIRQAGYNYIIRDKTATHAVNWPVISKVITFNSSIGIQALQRGIEVISSPDHSAIGSYTQYIGNNTFDYDRDVLLNFISAHQFKLHEKEKIECLINYYLSTSDGMLEKQ